MYDIDHDLQSRRLLTIAFTLISSLSAVSLAILPAVAQL